MNVCKVARGVAQPGWRACLGVGGVTLRGITSSYLSRFRVGEEAGDVATNKERLFVTPPRR